MLPTPRPADAAAAAAAGRLLLLLLRRRPALLAAPERNAAAAAARGRTFLAARREGPGPLAKRPLFTGARPCSRADAAAPAQEERAPHSPARGNAAPDAALENWTSLGVDPRLAKALVASGLTEPFDSQKETVPLASRGADVVCTAETGSGKTLAFLLPVLSRILRLRDLVADQAEDSRAPSPLGLILVPSRELAQQAFLVAAAVSNQFVAQAKEEGRDERPFCVLSSREELALLTPASPPPDLLIATPDSLYPRKNLTGRELFELSLLTARTRYVVLDEADVLVNTPRAAGRRLVTHLMGRGVPAVPGEFDGVRPGERVGSGTDPTGRGAALQKRQFLFTGATLPDLRSKLYAAHSWLKSTFDEDLVFVSTRGAHRVSENVKEHFVAIRLVDGEAVCGQLAGEMSANAGEFSGPEMERIDDVKRRRIASEVFSRVAMPPAAAGGRSETVLVFASSKHRAEQFHAALTESLAAAVSEAGGAPREWECAVMSASFSLETKAQMMARFIAGQPGPEGKPCVRVMVATANMSRGVDFPNVTLVIHADFPDNAADYLHRSGRTGRARNTGEVLSLIAPYDFTIANLLHAASRGVDVKPNVIRDFPALPSGPPAAPAQKKPLSGIFSRRQGLSRAIKNHDKLQAYLAAKTPREPAGNGERGENGAALFPLPRQTEEPEPEVSAAEGGACS